MASKNSKRGVAGVVIVLVGSLIAWIVFLRSRSSKTKPQSLDRMIQEKLLKAGYGKNQARYWAAVARHETADYTSNLFLSCNNLFGMSLVAQRQTTQVGKCPGKYDTPPQDFGKYFSPASAVDDLILYLRARKYPSDFDAVETMVAYMKGKSYFTGDEIAYRESVKLRLTRIS